MSEHSGAIHQVAESIHSVAHSVDVIIDNTGVHQPKVHVIINVLDSVENVVDTADKITKALTPVIEETEVVVSKVRGLASHLSPRVHPEVNIILTPTEGVSPSRMLENRKRKAVDAQRRPDVSPGTPPETEMLSKQKCRCNIL